MSKEAMKLLDALIQKYSDKLYGSVGPHDAAKFEEDCDHIKQALAEQPARQQAAEPVDFASLLREAEEIVQGKPTWKRFIDGTPLSNDIAVWMAVFAQDVARRKSPQPAVQQEPEYKYCDDGKVILKNPEMLSQLLHEQPAPEAGTWYAAKEIDAMVRDLDVAMNGEGAAPQAKLCDLMPTLIKRLTEQPAQSQHEPVAKVPGMAVQALAGEIVEALLADDKDGGYDLTAGLFGRNFSTLVRRWAQAEWATPQPAQPKEKNGIKEQP